MSELRDEWGMTKSDWDQIAAAQIEHDKQQRRKALRAIWLPPVVDSIRESDGCIIYRDNRGDEWTFLRAVKVTLAILLHRRNIKDEMGESLDMAYWDSAKTYGGYTVDCLWLYPRLTYQIFNEGECFI